MAFIIILLQNKKTKKMIIVVQLAFLLAGVALYLIAFDRARLKYVLARGLVRVHRYRSLSPQTDLFVEAEHMQTPNEHGRWQTGVSYVHASSARGNVKICVRSAQHRDGRCESLFVLYCDCHDFKSTKPVQLLRALCLNHLSHGSATTTLQTRPRSSSSAASFRSLVDSDCSESLPVNSCCTDGSIDSLSIRAVEPMRRCEIRFDGLCASADNGGELWRVRVRLDGIAQSARPYDFYGRAAIRPLAVSMARRAWSLDFVSRALATDEFGTQRTFETWVDWRGAVEMRRQASGARPHRIDLGAGGLCGVHRRHFGEHTTGALDRSATLSFALDDGRRLHVRVEQLVDEHQLVRGYIAHGAGAAQWDAVSLVEPPLDVLMRADDVAAPPRIYEFTCDTVGKQHFYGRCVVRQQCRLDYAAPAPLVYQQFADIVDNNTGITGRGVIELVFARHHVEASSTSSESLVSFKQLG
jgi:hypothetical protein